MADVIKVCAVGAVIGIDLSTLGHEDAAAVRAAWADATTDAAAEPAAVVTPSSGDRAAMLMTLSQRVTLAAIGQRRGRLWMLHAAAVATGTGEVAVFVGPSGRGKTTAARALGARFGYMSDETVGIEYDGRVRPYRKPLSIIEDPGAPKREMAPSALGLRALPDAPLRVGAIVLLHRQPDHEGEPVMRTLDLGDALSELVAQSSYLADTDAPLRFAAAVAGATGGIRSLTYRDAADLAALVPQLVADSRPIAALATPERRPTARDEAPPRDEAPAPRYRRAEARDQLALADPDRIALLTVDDAGHGRVHVISGIAPTLWRAADHATLEELTTAAVAAHGEPPDQDAVGPVRVAVGELIDAGLLVADEPH